MTSVGPWSGSNCRGKFSVKVEIMFRAMVGFRDVLMVVMVTVRG